METTIFSLILRCKSDEGTAASYQWWGFQEVVAQPSPNSYAPPVSIINTKKNETQGFGLWRFLLGDS